AAGGVPGAAADMGAAERDCRPRALGLRRSAVTWRRTLIVLALAIGAAYWSGLRAPFQFDDVDAIVENAAIRHWWPFAPELPSSVQVAGAPVVALSYAVNFQLSGLDPFGFRAVNLLIHFACAVLLFAIARHVLSRTHDPNRAGWVAAAIAVLWAVHPL